MKMENTEEIISSEDKSLSLFCHLSMLIGGILVPIIIWAIKKEQSRFVRFHALQSIFFHLAYSFVIAFIIVIFAVAIIFMGAGFSALYNCNQNAGLPFLFVVVIIIFLIVFVLSLLAGIGYSIYLAIKSYQGEKTKIFLIGNIIYDRVYGKS